MPAIAAMNCGRWLRPSGGGKPSQPPSPPGRGTVIENSLSHTASMASGSIPLITGAMSSSSLHTTGCGPVEISPMPTMPASVRTSTSVSSTRRVISCAVQRTRSAGMPIGCTRMSVIFMQAA